MVLWVVYLLNCIRFTVFVVTLWSFVCGFGCMLIVLWLERCIGCPFCVFCLGLLCDLVVGDFS